MPVSWFWLLFDQVWWLSEISGKSRNSSWWLQEGCCFGIYEVIYNSYDAVTPCVGYQRKHFWMYFLWPFALITKISISFIDDETISGTYLYLQLYNTFDSRLSESWCIHYFVIRQMPTKKTSRIYKVKWIPFKWSQYMQN